MPRRFEELPDRSDDIRNLQAQITEKLHTTTFLWAAAALLAVLGGAFLFFMNRCDALNEKLTILSDRLSRAETRIEILSTKK
jgi:hypothetical protein